MKGSSYKKNLVTGALCALCGVLAAFAVIIVGFGGFRGFSCAAKFAQVMRIIRTQFVGESDLDEVTDAALANAVASLDDDWSYYMDAAAYAEYQDYSANLYQGIGVTVQADEATGGFAIVLLEKDGPAQTAGLEVGDVILAVDGISVQGGTVEDMRALIQADYGKQAFLTVQRTGGEQWQVSVSCEAIYTEPVRYQVLDGHIGYIDIDNFHASAGERAIDAVDALVEQGVDSLVFDVRSNPGGQVSEMVAVLDHLLPEGDVFIRTDKKGREVAETSDAACVELPMAVVVDRDSYSAAEFFAAALRDYDWARIAGEATTGKARSQVTFALWDGSAVHLSKYSYLTPSRTDLYEAGGLVPDVEAQLTEEERTLYQTGWLEPEDDPQIRAAVGLLGP